MNGNFLRRAPDCFLDYSSRGMENMSHGGTVCTCWTQKARQSSLDKKVLASNLSACLSWMSVGWTQLVNCFGRSKMLEYEFWGGDVSSRDPVTDEIGRLRRARGQDPSGPLPGIVAESWKRCLADYNLTPDHVPRADVLDYSEMRNLAGSYEELLAVAEPEVEKLFLRLVDSEYLVSLASPQGVMMLFRCDHQFLGDMSKIGVLPGSVWAEERQGTNGVGTCLRSGQSVVIAGKQHYGVATQNLSCITAPVLGQGRTLQGVINVTTARVSDDRTNRVVLDIVERSARRIENRYFGKVFRQSNLLRLFNDVESNDLAEEGRLAIDDDGLIVGASSYVVSLTGLAIEKMVGRSAEEVFEMSSPLARIHPGTSVPVHFADRGLQAIFNPRDLKKSRPLSAHEKSLARRNTLSEMFATPMLGSDLSDKEFRIDPLMSQALDKAQRLYAAGMPLIVGGETGSGKTCFAEIVVRRCLGERRETLFIDCAAVTGQDAENNVFPFELLQRERLCIILDRFEELNEPGQIALQNFLENRDRQAAENVGIIAITSSDFETVAKSGKIRSSLLHRVKGGTVYIPPLRIHPDLACVINDLVTMESREFGRPDLRLSDEARLVMLNYHWPGNIRELRQAIRHAVVLAEGDRIGLEHLPEDLVSEIARKDLTARSQSQTSRIEAALRHNGGNVSLTARYLGVSRATLYRKIQIQKTRAKS
jgi:transcriptional regulator of acetoin/glycerol metabolism